MNISKYIAELLFDFECVVIPGLGGFIVNDKPSSVNRINHQFKPPFRNILFNTHLKANDGLLINQISSSENISFQEARSKVDDFVKITIGKLEKGDSFTFSNIGTIHFDNDKNIVFNQDIKFNYNPESYGLNGFVSPPVKRVSDEEKLRKLILPPKAKSVKPVDRKPQIKEEPRKKKRKFWPVLLTVGIILLLLSVGWGILNPAELKIYWENTTSRVASLSPKFVKSSNQNVINEARYIPRRIIESDKEILAEIEKSKDIAADQPIEEPVLVDAVPERKTETDLKEVPAEPVAVPEKEIKVNLPKVEKTGPLYYIIAGSFTKEKNAIKLVNKLKQKGFDAQIADTNTNGMFRVAYVGLRKLSEAKEKLYAIRQEDNPEAWIVRK